MSQIENLMTEGFLIDEENKIFKVIEYLEKNPLTMNQKVQYVMEEIRRALKFGINKGIFIEECRAKRVKDAGTELYKKRIKEVIYEINEEIDDNILKNKYKKMS